ncbi:MAG: hypothetical protein LKE53_07005 [Oscillospiraceae bacterium]|jgi:hypothetical protein|nr:hypothetical protein [Oscillospiraceae bacterium]MDD3261781.1 hypothetical protein [Oscillospiraceae bacterium]
MCLVITAFAAVIATLVWYFKANRRELHLEVLALMYWGASLMWTVDGFYCVKEGQPFLEMTADNALLGLVIVLCGMIAWTVYLVVKDPKNVFADLFLRRSEKKSQS